MKKKNLFLLIFIVLLVMLNPAYSLKVRASDSGESNFEYREDNGNAVITKYIGKEKDIVIPSKIDGYNVISIANQAFNNPINSIFIPETVIRINKNAFFNCSSLQSIIVDENNPNFSSQDGVLFNKKKTILLMCPGYSLSRYSIPDTVVAIEADAFDFCFALNSISIPENLKNIDVTIFKNCRYLDKITVNENNPAYSSEDGVLLNKDKTIILQFPIGKGGSYTIPESVKSIGDKAFYQCNYLVNLTIPISTIDLGEDFLIECEKLQAINVDRDNLFYSSEDGILYNKLKTVLLKCPAEKGGNYVISKSVKKIADWAFYYCLKLKSINIPKNVKSIGNYAFYRCCNLSEMYFYGDAPSIEEYSIANVNPDGFSKYCIAGRKGFDNKFFKNIKFFNGSTFHPLPTPTPAPPKTEGIDPKGFKYSIVKGKIAITGYNGEGGVVEIPAVIEGYSVESIDYGAFFGCKKITAIKIPDSIKYIGDIAFVGCVKLTGINIPSSVKSIGDSAFDSCESLSKIYFLGDAPKMGKEVFNCTSSDLKVYYLAESKGFSKTWLGIQTEIFMNGSQKKPVQKPITPKDFSVNITGNKANLSWISVTGTTGYKVYYKKQNESYKVIVTKNLKLQIQNLRESTKYFFKIAALNSAGEGKASNEIIKFT